MSHDYSVISLALNNIFCPIIMSIQRVYLAVACFDSQQQKASTNCSDETKSTIHLSDPNDRGVNYSVTIQEINVIFSTFKSFMRTVLIRYLITRKAGYSHFEIITGSTLNQAQITVSFNHPGNITHTPFMLYVSSFLL